MINELEGINMQIYKDNWNFYKSQKIIHRRKIRNNKNPQTFILHDQSQICFKKAILAPQRRKKKNLKT